MPLPTVEVVVSEDGSIIPDDWYRLAWRLSMDLIYLATVLLLFIIIAGLALGCANLGGVK